MAVKVEHNCQPPVLVDHTWFGVNEHTIPNLPHEVMQFGGMLSQLLWLIRHLTNGFYCIFLTLDDARKLAVMMPCYDGEPQLAAIPLSLTMGWTKSPPTFSATSETAADLANAQLTYH